MELQQFLPGWETVRLIGTGTFGPVYEIQKEYENRTFYKSALKVITIPQSEYEWNSCRDDGPDEKSIAERLRSEVDAIAADAQFMFRFRGISNIVSYEDLQIREHEGYPGWDILIRMELLDSLPHHIKEKGMTDQDVAKLGIDICRALEICCKLNGVHRAVIDPQNIFVNEFGDYKIGDFGKDSDPIRMGAQPFAAPEMYKAMPYGVSCDIYSLGLVMYWLLNERRLPFYPLPPQIPAVNAETQALGRRLSGESLPDPVHGTRELKDIVLKACAYEASDRFSSPSEMRKALSQI